MASGTSQILLDIKNRLEADPPAFAYPSSFVPSKTKKFVWLWNDTVRRMRDGKYAMIQLPAIFLEIRKPMGIDQYGNGTQVMRMVVRVHIVHKFLNANDNIVVFDQDLPIYEFKDWVYQMLQMFQPTKCGNMVRISEEPDFDHDMLVEYIQDYELRFSDVLLDQPIGALEMDDTTTLEDTITIETSP